MVYLTDEMCLQSKVFDKFLIVSVNWSGDLGEDEGTAADYCLYTSPALFWIFTDLMETSPAYRRAAVNHWTGQRRRVTRLVIRPSRGPDTSLDYTSSALTAATLWRAIELEDALHWLSTLGGAFSNLGESSAVFAERAGRNAFKQLVVGSQCGDLSVVAKCQLFLAHSELQLGLLRSAAHRVRWVWRLCHAPPLCGLAITAKLVTMCRGVWARVTYERSKTAVTADRDVEVEQKFSVPQNYKHILLSNGAEFKTEKVLDDEYLDTNDLELLKSDHWLRRRGEKYELKIPLRGRIHARDSIGMTQYREVSGKDMVAEEISNIIETKIEDLTSLVKILTTRESYELDGCNIVIDTLEDDGWSVAEIEVMSSHNENVDAVQQRIMDMGKKLNFIPQQIGKVEHCLESQRPEVLELLKSLRNC